MEWLRTSDRIHTVLAYCMWRKISGWSVKIIAIHFKLLLKQTGMVSDMQVDSMQFVTYTLWHFREEVMTENILWEKKYRKRLKNILCLLLMFKYVHLKWWRKLDSDAGCTVMKHKQLTLKGAKVKPYEFRNKIFWDIIYSYISDILFLPAMPFSKVSVA